MPRYAWQAINDLGPDSLVAIVCQSLSDSIYGYNVLLATSIYLEILFCPSVCHHILSCISIKDGSETKNKWHIPPLENTKVFRLSVCLSFLPSPSWTILICDQTVVFCELCFWRLISESTRQLIWYQ